MHYYQYMYGQVQKCTLNYLFYNYTNQKVILHIEVEQVSWRDEKNNKSLKNVINLLCVYFSVWKLTIAWSA